MTGPSTGYRRYEDEEFLHALDLFTTIDSSDEGVGTATIAMYVGCQMITVNRRLFALAEEADIEVWDAEREGDGPVDLETYESAPKRQLVYRRAPPVEDDT